MKKILVFLGLIFLSTLLISCGQSPDSGKVPEKPKTEEPVTPNEGGNQGQEGNENTGEPMLEIDEFTVPNDINYLNNLDFLKGKKIKKLIIPTTVKSIFGNLFYNVKFVVHINYSNDNIKVLSQLDYESRDRITSVTIEDSVTYIENGAFANTELTSVIIPDSVTYIGENAFANTKLTSVIIPDSVTYIRKNAFINTPLETVQIGNSVETIGNGAFANTKLTSVIIPDSVTYIGENAFANTKLTSVIIPDSVTYIGENAFANTKLTSVIIPDSVIKIGKVREKFSWDNSASRDSEIGVFFHTPLETVHIGNSVETIGYSAFRGTKLTEVTIPDSVKTIGYLAFDETKLTSVELSRNIKFKNEAGIIGNYHNAFTDNVRVTYREN